MVHLYNEKNIPSNLLDIKIPWDSYFRKQKVTKYLSDTDAKIVESVEGTNLLNNSTIYGKFSDMPISIGELSEGCKTLLCINHAIKVGNTKDIIFNITSCGGNAVNYLITEIARNVDVNAYCEHKDFGKNKINIKVKVGDKILTSIRDAREAYIDLCREEW